MVWPRNLTNCWILGSQHLYTYQRKPECAVPALAVERHGTSWIDQTHEIWLIPGLVNKIHFLLCSILDFSFQLQLTIGILLMIHLLNQGCHKTSFAWTSVHFFQSWWAYLAAITSKSNRVWLLKATIYVTQMKHWLLGQLYLTQHKNREHFHSKILQSVK